MKIRIRFSKKGSIRFIGHLDLMRTFHKAFARADLPVRYSEGFRPHPVSSFASALSVGETSEGEYMDTELLTEMTGAEILDRLNAALPEGLAALCVRRLPDEEKKKNNNAMAIFGRAKYRVTLLPPYDSIISREEMKAYVDQYLALPERIITKKTAKSEISLDLLPLIYGMTYTDGVFDLYLNAGSKTNLKPEAVMADFLSFTGVPGFEAPLTGAAARDLWLAITRTDMLTENGLPLSETGTEI